MEKQEPNEVDRLSSSQPSSDAHTPRETEEQAMQGGGDEYAQEENRNTNDVFTSLFNEYAADGLIQGVDLMEILRELGIKAEPHQVQKIVGNSFTEGIDMETASAVVEHFRPQDDVNQAQTTEELKTVETVIITPCAYFCRKLTCQGTPPNTEYVVKMPTITIQPRELLVGSTAFFMLVVGLLIIMTVALLWLSQANTQESKNLDYFGAAISSFVSSFEEQMIEKNAEELRDTAFAVSHVTDLFTESQLERQRSRMKNVGTASFHAMERAVNYKTMQRAINLRAKFRLLEKLERISHLSTSPSTMRSLFVNVSQKWASRNPEWQFLIMNVSSAAKPFSGFVPGEDVFMDTKGDCKIGRYCGDKYLATPGFLFSNEGSDGRGEGSTRIVLCTNMGLTAEAIVPQSLILALGRSEIHQYILQHRNLIATRLGVEPSLTQPNELSFSNTDITWMTDDMPGYEKAQCYLNQRCNDVDMVIQASLFSRIVEATYVQDKSGNDAVVASFPSKFNVAMVFSFHRSQLVEERIEEMIEVLSYMNRIRILELGFTIEAVMMLRNTSTGEVYQGSKPAISFDCLGYCERFQQGKTNAIRGFDFMDEGMGITMDYRPQPVVSGYAYAVHKVTPVVSMIERDVIEIRTIALESLAGMLNNNNGNFLGTFEIQLVQKEGALSTQTYDPYEPCPRTAVCVRREGFGTIYRSDCSHCTRLVPSNSTNLRFLTTPKLLADCAMRGRNCSAEHLAKTQGLARRAVNSIDIGEVIIDEDYRGEKVLGFYGYQTNFSCGYYLKEDYSDIFDPITNMILISLGSSIGIVAVALLVLMILSQRLVTQIEDEWMFYKDQIQDEREAFGDTVREMFPIHVAETLMKGEMLYTSVENFSVAFVDITGTTKKVSDWTPLSLCRYITYIFHVSEMIAIHYGIHRLRTIGDTSILVGGLNDQNLQTENEDLEHHAVRMLRCCTNLLQLSAGRFAHFPHRCKLMATTFGKRVFDFPDKFGEPEHVGYIVMPNYKIGVHLGASTSVLLHSSNTPHFDILGPTLSTAQKITNAASHGCIFVSETVKEQVMQSPVYHLFGWSQAKKTLLRGRGSITGYYLERADVVLPQVFLKLLGIRYSKLRVSFGLAAEKDKGSVSRDQSIVSTSTTSTVKSHQSAASSAAGY